MKSSPAPLTETLAELKALRDAAAADECHICTGCTVKCYCGPCLWKYALVNAAPALIAAAERSCEPASWAAESGVVAIAHKCACGRRTSYEYPEDRDV